MDGVEKRSSRPIKANQHQANWRDSLMPNRPAAAAVDQQHNVVTTGNTLLSTKYARALHPTT